MRLSLLVLFTLLVHSAFSQDTIPLIKYKQSAYCIGGGFKYVCDELMCGVSIDKTVTRGNYVLTHNGGIIAKVNYISPKEYLVYYYSSSSSETSPIITKIEYFPYFKISLDVINSNYQITSMETYRKAHLMEFQLSKEQCYIGIFDKKRHKSKKIILDLEFIN